MKIIHLRAHNFRSICDLEMDVGPLMVLLGPNNHGKSNILAAIEFALNSSFKVSSEDFCAFRLDGDNEFWVELTFSALTQQENTTFARYIDVNSRFTFRKCAVLAGDGSIDGFYHGYVEQPSEWWLHTNAAERLNSRESIQAESERVPQLRRLLEGSGRISRTRIQEFQDQYIQQNRAHLTFDRRLEEGPLLGTRNVAAGVLPDFYLIPAVRDLGDETKTKNTAVFGRLLQRAVAEMTERDPRVSNIRSQIASLVEELNLREESGTEGQSALATLEQSIEAEIRSWGVRVGIRVTPPGLERLFELGTELRIDDGHDTVAEKKGHGLQRAILFGLVRAWASALRSDTPEATTRPRRASESIIFAVEEPELFLHPHAQRVLDSALREFSRTEQHQVFMCTHSTHFVNLDDYRSIVIANKESPQSGTRIRQCTTDLFEGTGDRERKNRFHMAMWINPDRGELFFARKVILVEGETEKACLPYLAEQLGCSDPSVSIIDCGSKHNLPLYVQLLNAFHISYTVIHDEDPVPNPIPQEWTEDKRREKRRTFELNHEIVDLIDPRFGYRELCSPDFEGFASVSKSQGVKKGKPIAALEYFGRLRPEDLSPGLTRLIESAFRVPAVAQSESQRQEIGPVPARAI